MERRDLELWTIGHSTLPIEDFVGLLAAHAIELLADVRRFPASRRYPHFNREALSGELDRAGVGYRWMPELGGRRRARPDSRNVAWRNESFRGYADYMETAEFEAAFDRLLEEAARERVAVMCAEAVWWRCHRGLIADYAKVRGVAVIHITSASRAEPHPYTSAARVVDGRLSYAGLFDESRSD